MLADGAILVHHQRVHATCPPFQVEVTLDAPDASDEQLTALKGAVDAHCPLVVRLHIPRRAHHSQVRMRKDGQPWPARVLANDTCFSPLVEPITGIRKRLDPRASEPTRGGLHTEVQSYQA